eukprot:GEMP01050525.1.p1 GENE.GEMP01050525.1~~GEMP01050525.1.p1  ORF type:complete len:430 (+),score=104.42 GEMP01050525.1:263-1552(+)
MGKHQQHRQQQPRSAPIPVDANGMASIQVQVPPGGFPGQQLDVPTPDGQTMRIAVPQGMQGGSIITMQYKPLNQPPTPNKYQVPPYQAQNASPGHSHHQSAGGHHQQAAQSIPYAQSAMGGGKRKAVLIGCNYRGQNGELRGCINDTKSLQDLLMQTYGFERHSIRVLTDDTRQCLPTRRNIMEACRWLVEDACPGDVFFFSFSGHGAQKEDPNGYEEDGMNETILPLDFQSSGMITDDELNKYLVQPLPSGSKLTCVMDACHSGTGLDLPYTWSRNGWKEETNPFHTQGDVIMLSGCEDDDTSADTKGAGGAGGAMTMALTTVLSQNPSPHYGELLPLLHQTLTRRGFRQRPVLTSSQRFDFSRRFRMDGTHIVPNQNTALGRTFRKKFKPKPSKKVNDFMQSLGLSNGIGAAMIGFGLMRLAGALFD